MTAPVLLAAGIVALIALAVVSVIAGRVDRARVIALDRTARRRDPARHRGESIQPEPSSGDVVAVGTTPVEIVPWTRPTNESISVTRRQFFNRGILGVLALTATTFTTSLLGFLWPSSSGGFGSKVKLQQADLDDGIRAGKGFYYVPEGRMWVTAYPARAVEKAVHVYPSSVLGGMQAGYVFLYQKCPHLGCRVPSCTTSQWFECPCHGSKYNRVGEKKSGPAPRGMDRFAVQRAGSTFTVDTGSIVLGPTIGTNTTGQEAEGPHCVTGRAA